MKIHLEELEHQREALDAILRAMPQEDLTTQSDSFANPVLQQAGDEKKFIDIKMETGTGKTYVYTRAMYELHREFGLYKFIIVVPSLAIKEGTKNFITSDYAHQHFSRFFPNKKVEFHTINAGDFAARKGRRKNFPAALMQFCDSTRNEKNTIQCLLLSDKGFLDRKDSALFKDDYDQTLFGGSNCPVEAIKNICPVVIIDEPHRIKRDGNTYKNLIEKINPQMIIRFGATFPEAAMRGIKKPDYYRGTPQYDLGAVEAFNKDLVKGVVVQFPNLPENAANRFKVAKVTGKELVLKSGSKEWVIKAGEDLSSAGGGFDGDVFYDGGKKLSNELELEVGMELVEGVFSNSYQELLLAQAIDAHFAIEVSNFHREGRGYKVKTNALFFIDSIKSYREEEGWLKTTFERLLAQKLDSLLEEYKSGEYHDFLLATRRNIPLSHGGYFAKDWGQADDSAIAEERDDILHKERTLPFKKADGTWNIRRFFFSKWTLREGWDNPNIFTICKLRTSGSETSKIQEVGRGLRLPVDEQGNRLSNAEWKLNFIIGWDEKDFATKLVNEINADAKVILNTETLTGDMIKAICESRKMEENALLETLDNEGVIKRNNDFKEGGYDKLIALYPELLQTQVKQGKVTSSDMKKRPAIKLRVDNWNKIRDFWEQVSKRYMLSFERLEKMEMESLIEDVFNTEGIFDDNKNITVTRIEIQKSGEDGVSPTGSTTVISNTSGIGKIPYNQFVEQIAKRTSIPIQLIHAKLWSALEKMAKDGLGKEEINAKLNQNSIEGIIGCWTEKFAETFAQKYSYHSLDFTADTSVLKNGSFVTELKASLVGRNPAHDVKDDPRNLYEKPLAYDSEIEHEVEKIVPPPKVIVFGKLPRLAIKAPTYTGGSTTPDFVYATEREGKVDLTLLVETKAKDMRGSEKRAVAAQERLFRNIKGVKWELVTDSSEVHKLLDGL